MLRLIEAIEEARRAATDQPGEREALARFRGIVGPVWVYRPALGEICASDSVAERRLREIDRLRYAEEHAVRYGSVDLAHRRQEVERLVPILRKIVEAQP